MYENGYAEEIARRNGGSSAAGRSSAFGNAVSMAFVAAAVYGVYLVVPPVMNLASDVDRMAQEDRIQRLALKSSLGHCFDNGMGAVGVAIYVESGEHLKLAFESGITQSYPVAALHPAVCPTRKD